MSASSVSRLLWDEVDVVSASDSDLRIWDLDLTIKADRAVILLGRFGCRESACVHAWRVLDELFLGCQECLNSRAGWFLGSLFKLSGAGTLGRF